MDIDDQFFSTPTTPAGLLGSLNRTFEPEPIKRSMEKMTNIEEADITVESY